MVRKMNLASLLNVSDDNVQLISENKALASALSTKVAGMCDQFRRNTGIDADALEEDVESYFERRLAELGTPKYLKTRVHNCVVYNAFKRDPGKVKDFISKFPNRQKVLQIKNLGQKASAAIVKALEPVGFPQG